MFGLQLRGVTRYGVTRFQTKFSAQRRGYDDPPCVIEGESVTLRPVRSASPLRRERGVWVFHSSGKIAATTTDEVLRNVRTQRDRDNRG